MGGTGTVRAFLKGGADLVDSLPSSLGDLVRVNHPGVSVEIVYEPCPRSDLFLQQMEGSPFPEELREQGLFAGPESWERALSGDLRNLIRRGDIEGAKRYLRDRLGS